MGRRVCVSGSGRSQAGRSPPGRMTESSVHMREQLAAFTAGNEPSGVLSGQVQGTEQPEVAEKALREIREVSHEALQELRATVGVLRTGLDDTSGLAPTPQLKDLGALIASFQDAGLTVEIYTPEDIPNLGAAQQLAVYRIVQEALTNVVRHAGRSSAEVSIVFPPGEVSVEVVNDGEVIEPSNEMAGQGLVGMRERVVALGGSVDAHPRPDGGFRVKARFPGRRP